MALSVAYFSREEVCSQNQKCLRFVALLFNSLIMYAACSHCSLGSSQGCISEVVSIHPAPSYKLLFQSDLSGRYAREA